jgi:branched-chain amino acid aminotransferase
MAYFIFNGKFFEASTPIIGPDNRGLRYGDGIFETIKCINAEIIFAEEHMHRLWKGMEKLQFDPTKLFTPEYLLDQIDLLLKKNKIKDARIRLSIFRRDGGLFDPVNHQPNFTIQSWPLQRNSAVLNENGLQLCVYKDAKKQIDIFSNIKHNNFLPYSMAALYAKSQKCNDAVILNNKERICETSIANIFLVKDAAVTTPPITEGCIAGIMRAFVIQQLKANNFNISEAPVTQTDLAEADEIFLSNSISNIKWVAAVDGNKYTNELTRQIFSLLQKTNPSIIC